MMLVMWVWSLNWFCRRDWKKIFNEEAKFDVNIEDLSSSCIKPVLYKIFDLIPIRFFPASASTDMKILTWLTGLTDSRSRSDILTFRVPSSMLACPWLVSISSSCMLFGWAPSLILPISSSVAGLRVKRRVILGIGAWSVKSGAARQLDLVNLWDPRGDCWVQQGGMISSEIYTNWIQIG